VEFAILWDVTPHSLVDRYKGEEEPVAFIFRIPEDGGIRFLRNVGTCAEDSNVQADLLNHMTAQHSLVCVREAFDSKPGRATSHPDRLSRFSFGRPSTQIPGEYLDLPKTPIILPFDGL
jgi:hypothetical protein